MKTLAEVINAAKTCGSDFYRPNAMEYTAVYKTLEKACDYGYAYVNPFTVNYTYFAGKVDGVEWKIYLRK